MTPEEFKKTLEDKLKCDKNTLVDNLCLVYIGAMVDMISAKCMQQQLSNVQTNIQEINNFIIQKVNTNLYETKEVKMTYKDLFDAQHEYCTTEDYPGTAIRPHAFIAGAKWAIKRLSAIPADKVLDEVAELYKAIKQEEELTKWNLKKMKPSSPNKCEDCDRFNECYTRSGRMREFCKMYSANVVFKRKEQCSKLAK